MSAHPSEQPAELVPPQGQVAEGLPSPHQSLERTKTVKPMPATSPLPTTPSPVIEGASRASEQGLLIGLVILVIAGGILGSLSLLTHLGVIGAHSSANISAVRGGTWTDGLLQTPIRSFPLAAAVTRLGSGRPGAVLAALLW